VFGRRKKHEESDEDDTELETEEAEDAPPAVFRPKGPWDAADAPEDDVNRLDLGGLRIPVPPDTEVRVDVDPTGNIIAATLVRGASSMQVNVFAAPRTGGIWAEVREEMVASLREGGGRAEESDGPYGVELHADIPSAASGQPATVTPARFLGVDGPRWFLRALIVGPAASVRAQAAELEAALKDFVVHRGTEAMAVRSPLPLRLPREVTEQAASEEPPAAGDVPSLELPGRGPEITERR